MVSTSSGFATRWFLLLKLRDASVQECHGFIDDLGSKPLNVFYSTKSVYEVFAL
jgi:hypothetical protein